MTRKPILNRSEKEKDVGRRQAATRSGATLIRRKNCRDRKRVETAGRQAHGKSL